MQVHTLAHIGEFQVPYDSTGGKVLCEELVGTGESYLKLAFMETILNQTYAYHGD